MLVGAILFLKFKNLGVVTSKFSLSNQLWAEIGIFTDKVVKIVIIARIKYSFRTIYVNLNIIGHCRFPCMSTYFNYLVDYKDSTIFFSSKSISEIKEATTIFILLKFFGLC